MTQDELRQRMRDRLRQQAQEELDRATKGEKVASESPLVTLLPVPRETLDEKAASALRVMVFVSSSGGEPHVVTRLESGSLVCTCPAMRSVETRPRLCWAAQSFRAITGMEQP